MFLKKLLVYFLLLLLFNPVHAVVTIDYRSGL
jgi:hypothetical protein